MTRPGRLLRQAFLAPANLMGLVGACAASAVVHDPTAAAVAGALEALYLAGVLASAPFRRALKAWRAHVDAGRELDALVERLAPSQKEHFFELKALRDQIEANYRKLPGVSSLGASSQERVDALLGSFVRLLASLNAYRTYLSSLDRAALERELSELKREVPSEPNDRLKEVKERRLDILTRRVVRFQQAEESRELMSHQLAGIEDLLRLTHEQSLSMRDPEVVGRQLDALSVEVEATEQTLREMEQFWRLEEPPPPRLPEDRRVRG